MTGLFTALTCVATLIIQIPIGIGYINFGDAIVYVAAAVVGPTGAAIAGALGSAAADLITGYAVYAPFSFVVKGLEGLVAGILIKKLLKRAPRIVRLLVAYCLSALIPVIGYAFADFLLVVVGFITTDGQSFSAAFTAGAVTVPWTLIQVGVSVAVAAGASFRLPTVLPDFGKKDGSAGTEKEDGERKEKGDG